MVDEPWRVVLDTARQKRAERAAQLRAQGLSLRKIGEQLGISASQVLKDLGSERLDRTDIRALWQEGDHAAIVAAQREGRIVESTTVPVNGSVRLGDPIPGGDAA